MSGHRGCREDRAHGRGRSGPLTSGGIDEHDGERESQQGGMGRLDAKMAAMEVRGGSDGRLDSLTPTGVERQPFRSMGFVSVIIASALFALGLPLVLV